MMFAFVTSMFNLNSFIDYIVFRRFLFNYFMVCFLILPFDLWFICFLKYKQYIIYRHVNVGMRFLTIINIGSTSLFFQHVLFSTLTTQSF